MLQPAAVGSWSPKWENKGKESRWTVKQLMENGN